jgi:AraC-like DNA-binding protein
MPLLSRRVFDALWNSTREHAMHTVDLILRFAAITQLALIAVLLLKDHRDKLGGILAAPFALSIICYLLATPAVRYWQWGAWSYPLVAGAGAAPVLFWLLAKSLFEDSFRFRSHHVFILFIVVAIDVGMELLKEVNNTGVQATDRGLADHVKVLIPQSLVLTFVFLGLFYTIKDWRTDLVEGRRRFRFEMLATTGIYMIVIAAGTLVIAGSGRPAPISVQTLNAAIIFIIVFIFNVRLLTLHAGFLPAVARKSRVSDVSNDDRSKDIKDLQRLMEEEHVFIEGDLTICKLAEKLGQHEYKLRQLINAFLGYRNFNDFLNQYRIAEAAKRLVHADSRRLPVLTIAMDVGYRTLRPFNKAFKEIHGVTPTEYRRSKASPASNPQSADTA